MKSNSIRGSGWYITLNLCRCYHGNIVCRVIKFVRKM